MATRPQKIWLVRLVIALAAAIFSAFTAQFLTRETWKKFSKIEQPSAVIDPSYVVGIVETVMFTVATAVALWMSALLLLLIACYAARFSRGSWARGERLLRKLSPKFARITLTTVITVGLGTATLAPAHASSDELGEEINLSWAAHTDVTVGATDTSHASRTPKSAQSEMVTANEESGTGGEARFAAKDPDFHTVVRGDSLWSISANQLPAEASNAQIDAAWRELYHENREIIGADPNFLLPGTNLKLPD